MNQEIFGFTFIFVVLLLVFTLIYGLPTGVIRITGVEDD